MAGSIHTYSIYKLMWCLCLYQWGAGQYGGTLMLGMLMQPSSVLVLWVRLAHAVTHAC